MHDKDTALIGESEADNQRKSQLAIQPANLCPWNWAAADFEMRIVDLNARAECYEKNYSRTG